LQPGRLQCAANRTRRKIDNDLGFPADLGRLADRLRGEFRRARYEQRLGARALEIDDLGVHGRFGYLIGGGDHALVELSLQERLEGVDVVFAEVIVLEKDRILRAGQYLVEELSVNSSLGLIADQAGRGQRILVYVGELAGAADDGDRRNALAL